MFALQRLFKKSIAPAPTSVPTSQDNIKHQQLSELINNFVFSNMFNTFKVIYAKDCESWYELVVSHIGGIRRASQLTYSVEVLTYMYSDKQQSYIQQKYFLDDITGPNIADACFTTISEVSQCDALGIYIKAKDHTVLTPKDYTCCFLFARM